MRPIEAFRQKREAIKARLQSVFVNHREVAKDLFRALIDENADTAFGRDHGFSSIKTIAEYQKAVPIREYDAMAPWIERAAAGETNVLSPQPILLFRRTSGTTGASKKIPVTARSFENDMLTFKHMTCGHGLETFPELWDRPNTILNMNYNRRHKPGHRTDGGLLWQSMTDHLATLCGPGELGYGMPGSEASWWDSGDVLSLDDLAYFRLRLTLESPVCGVMAINPSTIVALGHRLSSTFDQLVDEVAAGTLFGKPRFQPSPERARELKRLRPANGPIRLRDIWPDLRYGLMWKAASCALYLDQVRDQLGTDVKLIPFPFVASEGIFATHLDEHPTSGFLLPEGVLHEFAPADGGDDHSALQLHEVELDGEYRIVHSAWNGLYRHALGDIFKVVEMVKGVPRVEYVGRRSAFSSFTGEKLTERQNHRLDGGRVPNAWRLGRELHVLSSVADPPYYAFVIEPIDSKPVDVDALARLIDDELAAHNEEYPSKRKTARLGAVHVFLAAPGTFLRYRDRLLENANALPTQMKEKQLQKDEKPLGVLLELSGPYRSGKSVAVPTSD